MNVKFVRNDWIKNLTKLPVSLTYCFSNYDYIYGELQKC